MNAEASKRYVGIRAIREGKELRTRSPKLAVRQNIEEWKISRAKRSKKDGPEARSSRNLHTRSPNCDMRRLLRGHAPKLFSNA